MIIAFFGHSDYREKQGDKERVIKRIEELAKGEQVSFYLGGYGKFDRFAFSCAKEYKKRFVGAKLCLITPYPNKLPRNLEYERAEYDESIYPSLEKTPLKYAIIKRNEWIVEKSDYIFAFLEMHYGGTYRAIKHAVVKKKSYENIYDGDYELY